MNVKLDDIGEIPFRETQKSVKAVLTPLPIWFSRTLREHLSAAEIHTLYSHQKDAIESVYNGNNVVVATGTSSGKSLCFQIPLMDMLLSEMESCAIMIFPTKALTQDQYRSLVRLVPEKASEIAIYDGDTPRSHRTRIRERVRILLTNPDMLHTGILPYHNGWQRLFQNLKFIVIDEAHIYRGVFGSQTSNLFRRLKRIANHYGTIYQVILASATLSNAKELSEKLTGESVCAFLEDFSGNGPRETIFLNPPVVQPEMQIRAGSIYTTAKTVRELLNSSRQVLVFCQSRITVESTVRKLRAYNIEAEGYRSGYLSAERREIEAGLKIGKHRVVAATNALELGMDIGGIDSVVSIGYPGSVSALRQRQGRAGRGLNASAFVLIATQTPTDQYLMIHPEFLSDRPCEPVLLDPNNLLIVLQHLQCALFELPFRKGDIYGNLTMEETQDLLDHLVAQGAAHLINDRYYWISPEEPQLCSSLRGSGPYRIAIFDKSAGNPILIGEIDRSSACWMIHEGAVYYHNGVSYIIQQLDLENNVAYAKQEEVPYSTEAQKQSEITVNKIIESTALSGCTILTADVTVHTQVVQYKKISNENHQILEIIPLDIPEETLETQSFAVILNDETRDKLNKCSLWNNTPNNYGPDWPKIRKQVLQRDGHVCRLCHTHQEPLHVHHITPFRSYQNKKEANALENLITLCPNCHQRAEEAVRIRSGLSGYAFALHQITSLFLECAPEDISSIVETESSSFDGRPAIFLHENVFGGLGLSQSIKEEFLKINAAVYELITHCACEDGCPGCIGAAGENGIGGKAEALAICSEIGSNFCV